MEYFSKMKGTTGSPPRVSMKEVGWSWVGAFVGISAVAYINFNILSGTGAMLLIASFAASAVLIYGAPKSPLAQPRNAVGGHLLAAFIGVAFYKLLFWEPWLASGAAVATAIAAMHLTRTLHPPAGATCLIAVIGGDRINALGFHYVLMPVAAGISIMVLIAVLINNISRTRKYPEFWI